MQNQTSYISPIANGQLPIADSPCAERTRLPWLDFASGIMILWMIVYHALQASWGYEVRDLCDITDASLLHEGVHAFINSKGELEVLNPCVVFPWLHFFMPWFFYKSGMLFKKRSAKDLWQKDSKKLLKTFIIWSFVGYLFFLLFSFLNNAITLRGCTYSIIRGFFLSGYIPINGPCWFLVTLFGVRLIANNVLPERYDRFAWIKMLGIIVVGYIFSYFAYRFNHRLLPLWVANGAVGMAFFTIGYALKDYEKRYWLIIPCLIIYLVGSLIGFPIIGMLSNELLSGNYLLYVPVSLCCVVAFNVLCKFICKYISVKPLEWVGKNAMIIFVVHGLIYVTINFLFTYFRVTVSWEVMFLTIIMAYILILPFACVIYNTLIAYKKN